MFALAACAAKKPGPVAEFLNNKQAAVFVFLAPDCPLSQNYTRTLNDVRSQFQNHGIEIYGVFLQESGVEDFVSTYKVGFPVVRDREFRLADYFGATATPEVFVIDSEGRRVYRGAIDNWAPELGAHRTVITEHYLIDALSSLVQHSDVRIKETKAVGCFIERKMGS